MIKKQIGKIIIVLVILVFVLTLLIGLTACDRLEDREDYIEENGWIALITSEQYKTAKLIGNKENSVTDGEAVLPTFIKDYRIMHIQRNIGISLTISCFDFIPDKLYVPGINYTFSNGIDFPYPSNKIIFLSIEPNGYSNGYNLNHDNRYGIPYERSMIYYVPKTSLDAFENKYDGYTYGEFRGANVSYFYNYEDSPNGGYCWIDDLDEGDRIKTIPMDPQREGYEFAGWFLEDACITQFNFETFTMAENGELNLYAKWIQK